MVPRPFQYQRRRRDRRQVTAEVGTLETLYALPRDRGRHRTGTRPQGVVHDPPASRGGVEDPHLQPAPQPGERASERGGKVSRRRHGDRRQEGPVETHVPVADPCEAVDRDESSDALRLQGRHAHRDRPAEALSDQNERFGSRVVRDLARIESEAVERVSGREA